MAFVHGTLAARGTARCPVTGRHVKVITSQFCADASYATGGTDITALLDEMNIQEVTAVAMCPSFFDTVGVLAAVVVVAGVYRLKLYRVTSDTVDTPLEINAAVNTTAAMVIQFYGV